MALAVGTQFPDLVNKPLAYWTPLLPAGRSLTHSLVVLVPVGLLVVVLWRYYGLAAVAGAFTVGWGSHLVGDAIKPVYQGAYDESGAVDRRRRRTRHTGRRDPSRPPGVFATRSDAPAAIDTSRLSPVPESSVDGSQRDSTSPTFRAGWDDVSWTIEFASGPILPVDRWTVAGPVSGSAGSRRGAQ